MRALHGERNERMSKEAAISELRSLAAGDSVHAAALAMKHNNIKNKKWSNMAHTGITIK